MKTPFPIGAMLSLGAMLLATTASRAQSGSQQGQSLPAFGTLPSQTQSGGNTTTGATSTSAGTGSAFGQVPWLSGQLAVPSFAGSVLLNDRPPFFAGVKVNHSDLAYREGETLSVQFTAERDAYLYLIYHQADGKSYLLFPNEAHIANFVSGGKWASVPEPGQAFRFRISTPFGTEVLQVLATVQPTAELDTLVKKSGQAALIPSDLFGTLQQRLAQDLNSWTEHRVPIRTSAGSGAMASSSGSSGSSTSSARKGARVGLFIGINKFQTSEDKGEGGNARFRLGAEIMAQTMLQRGGLDPQRCKTLIGEQATRANIEAAITRWLPSVTQPGDTVFLFYAGHGGLVKNLDGTKPDGKDGVLTTYNNSFQSQKLSEDAWDEEARKSWISDSALARWLQELPGRQIAVMISSCHAGSMIDSKLLAKFGSREATRVKGISEVNTAVLVSCLPDEQTLSNPKKPVWLAQYLVDAMTRLPAPVTLQRAFEYYREQHRQRMVEEGDKGFHEPLLTDTALLPITLVP